jgi:hypothetical protein
MMKRCVLGLVVLMTAAACAANAPEPKSPEAAPPPASPSTPATQPGVPQQAQPYPAPPPPPAGALPGQPGMADTPESRATRDFDAAERELSVAAGDCNNACRALGSMDRAAGNICKLSTDKPRCEDASAKVRTAREKVKNSCGDCKETSTNRNDPVPSR